MLDAGISSTRSLARCPAAVPAGRVHVAGGHAALEALAGPLLGLGEAARPDGQHDLDRVGHVPDREVVVAGQQAAQLLQAALRVRVGGQVEVDRPPQQAHQQVAPALGDGGLADQLTRQLQPDRRVPGAEQAVVRQAQRLGQRLPVAGAPDLGQQLHDRGVPARAVVLLAPQPHPQPQGRRRAGVDQGQRVPLAGAYHLRLRTRPVLVDPDPAQAQGRPNSARSPSTRASLRSGHEGRITPVRCATPIGSAPPVRCLD
ncbi:hypothetical protein ACIBO5_14535 [Nonomuraea angiospora]|uniref:hypothetical protein n=1 Tax=Nonomuraea angiospora TaxID=46172 RepID=UPI0037BC0DA8